MSQETCIGLRFLCAIEDEAFHALPGGVYDRGFIRTYAKRLGLDSEDKVSEYVALTANQRIPEPALANDASELHTRSTADSGTPEPVQANDASELQTRSTADSGTPETAPTDDASDFRADFTDEAGTPELRTLSDLSIATLRLQPPRQTRREDTRGGLVGRIWDYEFSHAEQSVLQAMADHANEDGSECVPGLRRVAYKARMSERHVRRIWRDLERRHILLLESGGNGRGHIGKYRICLDNAKRRPSFETWLKSHCGPHRNSSKAPSEFRDVAQIYGLSAGLEEKQSPKAEQLHLEATDRKDDIDSETPKTPMHVAADDSESRQDAPVTDAPVTDDARQNAEPIEDKPIQH